MFFSASIALALILSFSNIAVHAAPIDVGPEFVPLVCTGPTGTGTCTSLKVASLIREGGRRLALNPAGCTNVASPQSMILNIDNACITFGEPNCQLDRATLADVGLHFSDDSDTMPAGVKSISCLALPGTFNGRLIQQ
ncbi:hypothetical protein B0H19DRAFT_1187379 [Mycena capillaripes]|nr:hypothetical protein B0H19DRAFT_1187379 [Mycena capillaripes]